MIATKQRPPYRGITSHGGKWLVKLRHRGKDVTIAHYEDPKDAAWAADFARYLLRGLDPACWGPKVAKPNFPPSDREGVNRAYIARCLVGAGVVSHDLLLRRWAEYDAAVRANRKGSAG
jgi:hypothetical protein